MARPIRIVVGEGRAAQQGLLRFVLEGEGFDVVGEARGSADLSGVIDEQRPDVVVLDDGIGVMAVSMVHEVAPHAKVVLVWPSAVVPIGGDARVEPARILRDLGPAVENVVAAGAGLASGAALTESFERPDWIDKVRKDPASLREKLAGAKDATKRPSVTHLQRRGKRLHPKGRRSKSGDHERLEEGIPAPVVVLPVRAGGSELEPVLDIGGGSSGTPADEPAEERSEWNRRLGTLALSGAAAVSALVLAFALGGGRVPVSVVRGGGILPPGVPGFEQPGSAEHPFGAGSLGGSGYDPTAVDEPRVPDQEGGTGTDGGLGGDTATPGTSGVSDEPAPGVSPGNGGTGGGGTGDGGTGDGGGGGGDGGGGTGGGGGGGDGGTGGGGGGGSGGGDDDHGDDGDDDDRDHGDGDGSGGDGDGDGGDGGGGGDGGDGDDGDGDDDSDSPPTHTPQTPENKQKHEHQHKH